MNPTEQVPPWVLKPLPSNAIVDKKLYEKLDTLAEKLPKSVHRLDQALQKVSMLRTYDAAANRASSHVWSKLESFFSSTEISIRSALIRFASAHMSVRAQARIFRRLVKDPNLGVRRSAESHLRKSRVREVALPSNNKKEPAWDQSGWLRGTSDGMGRHKSSRSILEDQGLPVITTVGELRETLDIRSSRQLGYFLLATEQDKGPYAKFTIPKRDGSKRPICAPKAQLLWIQRRILSAILDQIPAHDTAHGFVKGRSTVTNAKPHRKAQIILKFDLVDFFPTIHYYRVTGLFASLGYDLVEGWFSAKDTSREVAATLARLCCYTPLPRRFGEAVLPQGAPTSPAISNLVCRRLDSRLEGLAKKCKGVYTRYADDLTFSFKKKDLEIGKFRWWVDQICHQEGFFVNQKKFRVIRASQRQTVTGIVVNEVLRIPREERRRFRAILHNCRTKGLKSQAKGRKGFTTYLQGFASYVNMVHPKEGKELMRQVEEILQQEGQS